MKIERLLVLVLCFSFFTSCKEEKVIQPPMDSLVTTFYLIRHAEKERINPEDTDPDLNQEGLGRSIRWAEVFDLVPLDAIYSTDYERTTMTAAPTSVKKELTLQYYDPKDVDVAQFIADNLGKNVLIVGHSNTTPEFVNNLIGIQKYDDIDDYDNSNLFIVQIVNGKATDIRLKIN
ncbi:SixA phosphatase family protein [Sediminicola arcticus]|uniref:Phosphoglycerate mutase family protein n=1 Tax=Sediminicola arcticus TaxID=1574308 RepID=A0ABV2SV63_9FLAO